jgi:hypothetical protein
MSKKVDITKLDGNTLAQAVCILEGQKLEIDIAQVKEVIRCLAALEAAVMFAEEGNDRFYVRPSDLIYEQAGKLLPKMRKAK